MRRLDDTIIAQLQRAQKASDKIKDERIAELEATEQKMASDLHAYRDDFLRVQRDKENALEKISDLEKLIAELRAKVAPKPIDTAELTEEEKQILIQFVEFFGNKECEQIPEPRHDQE